MEVLKSHELYLLIFENALVAIGVTNNKGEYLMVNPAWCTYMGYTPEEAKHITVRDITPPDDLETSDDTFAKLMNGTLRTFRKKRRYKRKDGSIFWADLYVSGIPSEEGAIVGVLGIFVNIDNEIHATKQQAELNAYLGKLNEDLQCAHASVTKKNDELQRAYSDLERLARHDGLTGLYNRRTLDEIVEQEIQRSIRTRRGFAVSIADIDNFKSVNDTYGHDAGDYVLKTISHILLEGIRTTDAVGRWGGEEFLLIFTETSCEGAEIVLERVRSAVEQYRFEYAGQVLQITMTFGFSYHVSQFTAEEILLEADKALYEGKHHGKNRVVCHQGSCTTAQGEI